MGGGMSETAQAILAAALSLPDLEREEVAEHLLESLPPPDGYEEVTEEEFFAELERRREEAERDPSVLIPWEEVQRMMLTELDPVQPDVVRE
jgi:putative addiction module component (TIGR02574 family)